MTFKDQIPLVSCIMPTYNRRNFVPHAIRYFLRQEYENKELIIIDDGTDCIQDLVPENTHIRYFRLDDKISLGAKLNLACKYARGNIIANWDDDDWYAPRRLQYQVNALQGKNIQVCGINSLLYYDFQARNAYQYTYPADQRTWLLGSSLCYTKDLWSQNNFADINVGMDGLFVWAAATESVLALPDPTIAVHMIHDNNISPKKITGNWWKSVPPEDIQKLMQGDWACYSIGSEQNYKPKVYGYLANNPVRNLVTSKLKNVYACLVHENESTVADLVRNLHYHDPASTILLYNGGENKKLLHNGFPFEKYGVLIHPNPVPVKHGYLHTFALQSMEFCLRNIPFDSMTIVDSDQLCIRSGYSTYMGNFLASRSNIGMLSSKPELITPAHLHHSLWPALQALKEYDLWKPFLRKFKNGENKFVHWTFWPSSVFTSAAAKQLTRLFKTDKQLQQIMLQSKIWATEEVILPTLISLLGFEIALNPCSYEYVKYQQSFSIPDLNVALSKPDAYWMHPVERKYENELRKHTRQRFDHYSNCHSTTPNNNSTNMLTTYSLIDKVKNIQGWLNNDEADLLIGVALKACKEFPAPQNILEIGSYHGKSTVLLGSIAKEYFDKATVYAIDPHEGNVGAADQGIQTLAPSLEMFNKNISEAGVAESIKLIKDYSYKVEWDKPIALLFIDGLHDYVNVAKDFWHFADWVLPGGYIAFHDYADYYPGVIAFVDELLETGKYIKTGKAESMIVLQKI